MKKYRIIKMPGELYPYVPQYRGIFGRWINYQRPTLCFPYQADAKYATLEEAEKALSNLLERKKAPTIMKEIGG